MKPLAPLIFTSILLVSGCASSPQGKAGAQAPVPASSASTEHTYRCESGETIVATYPTSDSATVQYRDSTYSMKIAVSASGARYVGGGLEWWTKGAGPGSEGMLLRHQAEGASGDIIESCTEA
ncbi:MAG TPA: MliC family protein [Halomonas sp.]|nr:MliC family protein [Halomonas sp.]